MNARLILFLTVIATLPLPAVAETLSELPPLSDSEQWHPGKFIWGDLVTDDIDSAKAFYGGLLGWEFRHVNRSHRRYTVAFNRGQPVGGLLEVPGKRETKGHPRWIGYLSVPDVTRAMQSAVSAGGKVQLAPRSLPRRGEQAVLSDAEGAVFGVMKTDTGDPGDFLPEPGDWIWIQLLSRDTRKAGDFYRELAGFEVITVADSPHPDTLLLATDGYARATVMRIPDDRPSLRPAWLPFIRVTGLEASLAKAAALGGRVLLAPRADLMAGRLAVVSDPAGSALGLIEWPQSDDEGGR